MALERGKYTLKPILYKDYIVHYKLRIRVSFTYNVLYTKNDNFSLIQIPSVSLGIELVVQFKSKQTYYDPK